mgnify:CR=1 FL=1
MPNETQVALRLPADAVRRAAALAEKMARAPELRAWRLTRSAVLRLALLRGIESLEAEYLGKKR